MKDFWEICFLVSYQIILQLKNSNKCKKIKLHLMLAVDIKWFILRKTIFKILNMRLVEILYFLEETPMNNLHFQNKFYISSKHQIIINIIRACAPTLKSYLWQIKILKLMMTRLYTMAVITSHLLLGENMKKIMSNYIFQMLSWVFCSLQKKILKSKNKNY